MISESTKGQYTQILETASEDDGQGVRTRARDEVLVLRILNSHGISIGRCNRLIFEEMFLACSTIEGNRITRSYI